MAKAVLVMDMPESCSECKFMYEFQGIKKCQLMNVLNNGASKLSQSTFTQKRHDRCPLRELPEKKERRIGEHGERMFRAGFNACLNEIMRQGMSDSVD